MCLEGCGLAEILAVLADIEAGAGLVGAGEFRVTYDAGLWIIAVELFQKLEEGVLLQLGAGVSCFASLVETAFVADGDGAVVVAYGMNTLDALGQYWNDIAIALDVPVVRGLAEAILAGFNEAVDRQRLVAAAAGAVNHDVLHMLRP